MNIKKNNNIILIIILAIFFGAFSGIVGEMVSREFLFKNFYNAPFFGEINFSNGEYGKSNLVIRDAKKVIVEQEEKTVETINSAKSVLVGIFKKIKIAENSENIFNLNNYYEIENEIEQGLIITSDGWILTGILSEKIEKDNYIAITNNGDIYDIDEVIKDDFVPFYFLHLKDVKDLPVKQFSEKEDINVGKNILAVDWNGNGFLSSIVGTKRINEEEKTESSDFFSEEIILSDYLEENYKNKFLFSLSGKVVGVVKEKNKIETISHFDSAIKDVIKNKKSIRAQLEINYLDLSDFLYKDEKNKNGALIYKNNKGVAVIKGGVADLAGLKENDIIISAGGIEINKENNLTDLIRRYESGDLINIVYLRDDIENKIDIKLK